ncbi:MAG: YdcF family protein [Betaproteobacteria bacterium]|nr:YdcF family protein [Betaproteobacteria bacterium]
MSTHWLIVKLLSVWLLPPLDLIVVVALGLALALRWPRAGHALAWLALAALAALSTPVVGDRLDATLESREPPLADAAARASAAQAIVILGGGRNRGALEYGGETVANDTLARLRYGAHLARVTRLPVLVSGGKPDGGRESEAELMAVALVRDFGVPVKWREGLSTDTNQNARFSAGILRDAGVKRVILVTSAIHMPRAAARFLAAGLAVVPAPTDYLAQRAHTPVDFFPAARGLERSSAAFHEWIGILVGRWRG